MVTCDVLSVATSKNKAVRELAWIAVTGFRSGWLWWSYTATVIASVATATSLVVVSKLLPSKILRALSRTVLDTIKAMVKATPGSFDFSGKDVAEVFDAVVHGSVSSDEATVWLQRELMAATNASTITKIS